MQNVSVVPIHVLSGASDQDKICAKITLSSFEISSAKNKKLKKNTSPRQWQRLAKTDLRRLPHLTQAVFTQSTALDVISRFDYFKLLL